LFPSRRQPKVRKNCSIILTFWRVLFLHENWWELLQTKPRCLVKFR
jgi:hypothetical protein